MSDAVLRADLQRRVSGYLQMVFHLVQNLKDFLSVSGMTFRGISWIRDHHRTIKRFTRIAR